MGLIDKVNVEVNGSGDLLSTLSTYTTKILKPNIVDGKNILTQAMIRSKNTKYVIKYDYELVEDITIPDGCILEFDGGSINGAYTVTGTNTGIEAGLVKIFSTDITLAGTWNVVKAYPEWFGAKGDGVNDDTLAIRKVCLFTNSKIVFSDKVYIINIEAGSNNTKARTFFGGSSASNHYEGIGNATLKLGKDNGDTRIFKGFEAIFWLSGDRDYVFENITFDFNYTENPIYQYTSNNVGVEQNGQQCAIMAYLVASLRVNNCKFIEPSGTNTVTMRGSATSDHLLYEVTNCQFIRVGNKSYYQNEQTEAYHDVSTLGCHAARGGNPNAKLYANVSNNLAIGVGGNAYDFCECSAEEFIFNNNHIENYQIGVMPLGHKDTIAKITNNTFYKVGRAVGMWFNCDDYVLAENDYHYKLLLVDNNNVTIDIDGRLRTPNYNTINNKNGDYYIQTPTRFGLLTQMQLHTNHVKSIVVSNNNVSYLDYSDVPSSVFTLFGNETIQLQLGVAAANTQLDEIIINNNIIDNPSGGIYRNAAFNKTKKFQLTGNTITNIYANAIGSEIISGILTANAFNNHPIDVIFITDNTITQSEKQIAISKPAVFGGFNNVNDEQIKYVLFAHNIVGFVFSKDIEISGIPERVDYINKYITTTLNRPTFNENIVGAEVFDTTLGKPIYWTGTAWVDATGAIV